MEYIIEEIFDVVCDMDKILSVKFRIEGDGEEYYRELVDSDFYEWCYEQYINDGVDTYYGGYDEEEGDYLINHFTVDVWNMYYSDDETITEYIYDNYKDIKTLPLPKKD